MDSAAAPTDSGRHEGGDDDRPAVLRPGRPARPARGGQGRLEQARRPVRRVHQGPAVGRARGAGRGRGRRRRSPSRACRSRSPRWWGRSNDCSASAEKGGRPREAHQRHRQRRPATRRTSRSVTCSSTSCARVSASPAPTSAATRPSCGACTVHVDGESVKSCNVLAVQVDGVGGHHHRGPRHQRRDAPDAGGLPGAPRAPVRLLHAGDDHGGRRVPEREPEADRGRHPPRPRGQPLPLHRLPQHREGRRGRRGARRGGEMATTEQPAPEHRGPQAPQGGPRAHHRGRPLHGRHRRARDAVARLRAEPLRAREVHHSGRLQGAGHGRRRRRLHRRGPRVRRAALHGLPAAGPQAAAPLAAGEGQGPLRRRPGGGRGRRVARARQGRGSRRSRSTGSRCRP